MVTAEAPPVRRPFPQLPGPRRRRLSLSGREALVAYAFILPYIALFLLFRFGPNIAGFVMSFMDYRIAGGSSFVGLANYDRLVGDNVFWGSLRVTLAFTVLTVPLTTVIALGTAILTNRALRGIKVFRAVFFLPVVTSLVLAGIVWRWVYASSGPINSALEGLGTGAIPWLSSTTWVVPALAIMAAWNRFGFGMLILLAGLQAIPQDYLEAAEIDGANALQRFLYVKLPLLKAPLFFVIVIETIQSFQIFDAVYVMTQGGPMRGSYALVYMLYEQGFRYFDFGYASAIGIALFAITLVAALIQRRISKEGKRDS
jgi:multiple sugar transport system permease protein